MKRGESHVADRRGPGRVDAMSTVNTGQERAPEPAATLDVSAPVNGTSVIRAVDLTMSSGQRTIPKHVQLGVEKGVATSLPGPTGSGKTTLLAMRTNWCARDRQRFKTSSGRSGPPTAGRFPARHVPALPHWC